MGICTKWNVDNLPRFEPDLLNLFSFNISIMPPVPSLVICQQEILLIWEGSSFICRGYSWHILSPSDRVAYRWKRGICVFTICNHYITHGGAHDVMAIIIIGNGHGEPSSNPGWGWLHFHIVLILFGKVWIQLFSIQLWVNSRAGLGSLALFRQPVQEKGNSKLKSVKFCLKIDIVSHSTHVQGLGIYIHQPCIHLQCILQHFNQKFC